MNDSALRLFIRGLVMEAKEAKEKSGLPKSGGKLVHLKKELDGLKKMKESLISQSVNENAAEPFVAEYAHMQKYVNELEKIKAANAKLSEMLTNQISEVEGKITTETQKVKEMMGMVEPATKDEAKKPSAGMTKAEKSAVAKKAHAGKDIGKKGKGFEKVEKAAEKEYGSKEAGKKVAAAAMWKGQAKK